MMVPAERDEVVVLGFAPTCKVHDVVRLEVVGRLAPRGAASMVIAYEDPASHRLGDVPRDFPCGVHSFGVALDAFERLFWKLDDRTATVLPRAVAVFALREGDPTSGARFTGS